MIEPVLSSAQACQHARTTASDQDRVGIIQRTEDVHRL